MQAFPVEWCNSFFHVHSRKTTISNHLLSPILLLLRQNRPVVVVACISIKYERSCCGPEIGIRQYWLAYQVIFQLLKCSLLFLLPTKRYFLPTQFVVGLSKNEKYKDELSLIASKTKEALKLFHSQW